jgi:ribonuclease HI
VFLDGSAHGGKVGAAAILIRKDKPDRVLHYHLGPESKHTVHEAELVGMILALHLIKMEKRNATSCSIAVDNQAALKAFASNMRSPGHHLACEFLLLANHMLKRSNKCKYELTLRWMAGHCGIPGNEKADREAKLVASRTTSDAKTLPLYLRKPLLTNPAAAKRVLNVLHYMPLGQFDCACVPCDLCLVMCCSHDSSSSDYCTADCRIQG